MKRNIHNMNMKNIKMEIIKKHKTKALCGTSTRMLKCLFYWQKLWSHTHISVSLGAFYFVFIFSCIKVRDHKPGEIYTIFWGIFFYGCVK